MSRTIRNAALTLLGTAALAQPALAQSVTCQQMAALQQSGKNHFADIDGGPDDPTDPIFTLSTLMLDGAKACHLDRLDTTSPSYDCRWGGFGDEGSAEAARLALRNQVVACLPRGFHQTDKANDSELSRNFYTRIWFGFLQPTIIVGRSYSKRRRVYEVYFRYTMSLPED